MELNTFTVALRFAIGLEDEVIRFYTEAARAEKYSTSKETFLALAEEHKRHKKMLLRLHREEDVSDSDIGTSRLPISGLQPSDYVAALELAPQMSYTDVLRVGMEAEESGGKFYFDLAGVLKTLLPSVSRNFERFAQGSNSRREELETLLPKIRSDEEGGS